MLVHILVTQTGINMKNVTKYLSLVRPAPGSDQEQLYEEAGLQDLDGDPPP